MPVWVHECVELCIREQRSEHIVLWSSEQLLISPPDWHLATVQFSPITQWWVIQISYTFIYHSISLDVGYLKQARAIEQLWYIQYRHFINSNKKMVQWIVSLKYMKYNTPWEHVSNTAWLINSPSYPVIVEHATSGTHTANHLTGVLLSCTTDMWHNNRNSVKWLNQCTVQK